MLFAGANVHLFIYMRVRILFVLYKTLLTVYEMLLLKVFVRLDGHVLAYSREALSVYTDILFRLVLSFLSMKCHCNLNLSFLCKLTNDDEKNTF